MATKEGQTVFVEYSTAEKNQHMMTVMYTLDHKRVINGRIFKDYNREQGKTSYRAVDAEGNGIFNDTHDLPTLKKKFIENGKTLAMNVPKVMKLSNQKSFNGTRSVRQDDLKKARASKGRVKSNEKTTVRTSQKTEVDKQAKSPHQNPHRESPDREEQINEIRHPDYQNELENESEARYTEMSERDMELEEIRDHDSDLDKEQDQDLEMDI